MARISISPHGATVWASASDTYDWAHKPGARWPGSFLSGRRFVACFDSNGLCDLSINGGRGDQDCPGDELSAICADLLAPKMDKGHPCYLVSVGQFLPA